MAKGKNTGRNPTARELKWYYEEAKGHIDARAVECHGCRTSKKPGGRPGRP